MGPCPEEPEFTEKDELLAYRRPEKSTRGGYCGLKKWASPLVGVVCVVSVISFAFVLTNSKSSSPSAAVIGNTEMLRVLRQSAPGQPSANDPSNTDAGTDPQSQVPANANATNVLPAVESTTTSTESPSSSTTRRSIFDFFQRRNTNPSVRTSLGRIRGVNLTSRGGREYYGFYNVPYAEPPIGELRFMPPVPAKSWTGTRNATVKGSMCTQKSRYNPDVEVEGTEDCLHTNIFTPKLPRLFSRGTFPVLVYFFGGGFMHGTANDFSAEYFMDEDVVVVIVESRVGAFGFLNTGDLEVTGNMGLKDQVQALRWVQENIRNFGGDPNKVVAFGSSSGAMGAHGHLLSPMSNGLMSGVICFSGTMIMPGGSPFDVNPRPTAVELGIAMNCTDVDDSVALVSCLRNVSAWDIALNQPEFTPSLEAIPDDGNTNNTFFHDTPINIIMQGTPNNVPWLVGVNSAEAILQSYNLLLDQPTINELNNDFNPLVKALLGLEEWDDPEELEIVIDEIHDFYFGNETIDKASGTRFNLTNLMGDRYYYHPTKVAGLQHSQTNSVYWYYLTKEANKSYAEAIEPYFDPPYGVSHADEVQYVFFRPRYPYIPLDSPWIEFSKMFVKFLVSFADTGAPVNPLANGTAWPKVDLADTGIWYNLDDVPDLIEPFTERMQLWDSFPLQLLYNSSTIPSAADTSLFIGDDEVVPAEEEIVV